MLLWNYYVIPHFYMGADRLAYWNIFEPAEGQTALYDRLRNLVDRSEEGGGPEAAGPELIIARPAAAPIR